ncbi:serine/threonine-protein phosphatase [Anabaenopsis sp. FSS-46]|uniref:PP2C family protein-serine/threonine phosphatase n=1 Tax=Anabaenopsis sp. FSS-46 TaxID=2971766 RepID=UPI002473D843|nr:protein phosphatase 2C domain-containing protein [Anabaenopsis sp. FSS-46]MDH6097557.1 serine/threonine-protein phosphatase [Anabaenopsis sp. FSS-46]
MADQRQSELGLESKRKTSKGLGRDINQDQMVLRVWKDKSAQLAVVVDGMGGQGGGEVAAKIAADTFRELLNQPLPEEAKARYEMLLERFHAANKAIRQRASEDFGLLEMGATIVAAIITQTECLHLYAGDCRLYHFGQEQTPYVTTDQTWAQRLVKIGEITSEQARSHPMRSKVTSCLGGGSNAKLSVQPEWQDDSSLAFRQLHQGDVLILCSDGLHGEVQDSELEELVKNYRTSPDQLTKACVDTAKNNGSKDDISLIAIFVQDNHS